MVLFFKPGQLPIYDKNFSTSHMWVTWKAVRRKSPSKNVTSHQNPNPKQKFTWQRTKILFSLEKANLNQFGEKLKDGAAMPYHLSKIKLSAIRTCKWRPVCGKDSSRLLPVVQSITAEGIHSPLHQIKGKPSLPSADFSNNKRTTGQRGACGIFKACCSLWGAALPWPSKTSRATKSGTQDIGPE